MIQPRAEAGDVIIFTGVMQHCAMPNKSDKPRTAILIQMLPKVTEKSSTDMLHHTYEYYNKE